MRLAFLITLLCFSIFAQAAENSHAYVAFGLGQATLSESGFEGTSPHYYELGGSYQSWSLGLYAKSLDTFNAKGQDAAVEVQGYGLRAQYDFPLAERWLVFPGAGVYSWKATATQLSVKTGEDSGSSLFWFLGVAFQAWDRLYLEVEYRNYNDISSTDVQYTGVAARYYLY